MITREQCRAARALLGISQDDLVALAKVGKRTIADFERGATLPHERTLRDIRLALEARGIDFLFEENRGVGVRFR